MNSVFGVHGQTKNLIYCIYLHFIINIFTFSKQALMNFKMFATVHSLMNDPNLIDSYQAHLPVQFASNIELIRQM